MAGIIALIMPTLLGLFMLVGGVAAIINIRVDDVSEISYMTMEIGEEYYFEELILVDAYTCVGNDVIGYDNEDYLVCFTDKDGKVVYTSLRPDDYSDLAEKCEAYINDSTQSVGDVAVIGSTLALMAKNKYAKGGDLRFDERIIFYMKGTDVTVIPPASIRGIRTEIVGNKGSETNFVCVYYGNEVLRIKTSAKNVLLLLEEMRDTFAAHS